MTCARCESAAEVVVADFNHDALVCFGCGGEWLTEVVGDPYSSLRVFLGVATVREGREHARRVADDNAAASARERKEQERKDRDRVRATARRQAKQHEAEELREMRARRMGLFVQANGPSSPNDVAEAVGVSRRTLSRVIPRAAERGWIVTRLGKGGGIEPGDVAVPRDPGRAELEAADARCWRSLSVVNG